MADAILAQYTMGKAATALDKTKPWGVIVQTDGAQFYYVACLPVAKADDIIEIAKAHNAEVKDGENGTKELSIPNKPPIFLKAENGVAFLSIAPASLAKLPANPLEILGKMVGEYDLSVALAVKNIPEMYRQFAIGAMQAGLQQSMKKLPDETDEQFADRQKLAEGQIGPDDSAHQRSRHGEGWLGRSTLKRSGRSSISRISSCRAARWPSKWPRIASRIRISPASINPMRPQRQWSPRRLIPR